MTQLNSSSAAGSLDSDQEPRGYIIHTFRVPDPVKQCIFTLLNPYPTSAREFFVHVLACGWMDYKEKLGWVPIYCRLIHKNWKDLDWTVLQQDGLIEVTGYSKAEGISREFKVIDKI